MEEEISYSLKDEFTDIEDNIAQCLGEIRTSWHHIRLSVVGIFALCGIDGGVAYWGSFHIKEIFSNPADNSGWGLLFSFFLVLNLFLVFPGILYLSTSIITHLNNIASYQAEAERWKSRKKVISLLAKNSEKLSYFDNFALINAGNLDDYYKEIKKQTNNSYKIVYTISTLGFILIAAGIITGFVDFPNRNMIPYISAISGVLTEAISSIFFALHSRTVQQMKEYHNNLLNTQNVLLSFNLVDKTKDDSEKTKIIGQMITHLTDKQTRSSDKAEK